MCESARRNRTVGSLVIIIIFFPTILIVKNEARFMRKKFCDSSWNSSCDVGFFDADSALQFDICGGKCVQSFCGF